MVEEQVHREVLSFDYCCLACLSNVRLLNEIFLVYLFLLKVLKKESYLQVQELQKAVEEA